MRICGDLHIHTALSSCAQEDMTPNNIINMALLAELDVIAVTDHNSCENVKAVIKAAEGTELVVVPGLEVQTREEVHVLALFEQLDRALILQGEVYAHLPGRQAPPKILQKQHFLNEDDEVMGFCDKLLGFASSLTIEEVFRLTRQLGGAMIPAHIDRKSSSILSNLGFIPENLDLATLEISMYAPRSEYEAQYPRHRILQNSDAHELGHIGIVSNVLDLEVKTAAEVIHLLNTWAAI